MKASLVVALAWLSSGSSLVYAKKCRHATKASSMSAALPEASVEAVPNVMAANEASTTPTLSPSKTNSTTMYGPTHNPSVDPTDWNNYKPSKNVSLYYGSKDESDTGAVQMNLAMLSEAVALEYIDTITKVDCGRPDDSAMTIFFNSTDALNTAVADWSDSENIIMITNHFGTCDEEFERGFFLVETLTPNLDDTSLKCVASKKQISDIADNLELSFQSLPAATLTKRITLDPSTSLSFSEALPENTVLLSEPPYVNITANEAFFTSTITFSGYLHYNFWGFKLEQLYFDIDANFSSNVEMAVNIGADYQKSFTYAPDELSYSLVDVPGIVKLGPGIAFAVGVDLDTSGKVDVLAGLGVSMPDGNVHVDLLDDTKSTTSGWTPQYNNYAKISEKAQVGLNASASVTVELAIDVLGGLIDLSSGLTATPGFNNVFTLDSTQAVNGTVVGLPNGAGCDQGVSLKSDFVFDLTAFVTKWYSASLYSTDIPIVDKCYEFV